MDSSGDGQRRLRLAVVDDDPWAQEGLRAWLSDQAEVVTCIGADRVDDILGSDKALDVVILDVQLRNDPSPVQNVSRIVADGAKVLLVSALFDERSLRGAIAVGASGFLPKATTMNRLMGAIRMIADGGSVISQAFAQDLASSPAPSSNFTPTETLFLSLYATDLPLKVIARRMGITYETAKTYAKNVREKYRQRGVNIDSAVDLYLAAVKDGIVTARPDIGTPRRESDR